MKQLLRSFSAGLFAAGVVLLVAYYFSDAKGEELTIDEMIPLVEKEGYHILSADEYISLAVQPDKKQDPSTKDNAEKSKEVKDDEKASKDEEIEKKDAKDEKNTEEKDKKDKEDKKEKEEPKTVKYTLKIKEGMLTPEISNLLKENSIIEDAAKFTNYLEEHDYSPKIQIGTFKLTSEMDYYTIAETITNYSRGQ